MKHRRRRSFTDEYKLQAVDLVASRGRSIGSVAKELGLRDSVLRYWVEQREAGFETTAEPQRRFDGWRGQGLGIAGRRPARIGVSASECRLEITVAFEGLHEQRIRSREIAQLIG